jgi:hypothetical protein
MADDSTPLRDPVHGDSVHRNSARTFLAISVRYPVNRRMTRAGHPPPNPRPQTPSAPAPRALVGARAGAAR